MRRDLPVDKLAVDAVVRPAIREARTIALAVAPGKGTNGACSRSRAVARCEPDGSERQPSGGNLRAAFRPSDVRQLVARGRSGSLLTKSISGVAVDKSVDNLGPCFGEVTIRRRCAGVRTTSAGLRQRGRRTTSEGLVHVPSDDASWAANTARSRPAASAVLAARLSDAEAKATRLDCHDHRRRRAFAAIAAGSAGCGVTYRIKPKYVGTQELN